MQMHMQMHNKSIKTKTMNKEIKNKTGQESINTLISELVFIANNKVFKHDIDKHILSVLKDNKNALKSIINNK